MPDFSLQDEFIRGDWRVGDSLALGVGVLTGDEFHASHHFAGNAHAEAIFDLASVSKTFLAVTTARLCSHEELHAPLGGLWPLIAPTPLAERSLADCLSHRAGLPAHKKYFRGVLSGRPINREAVFLDAAACATPKEASARPGSAAPEKAVYSDLGYLLTGGYLQWRYGKTLDELLRSVLIELGLSDIASARGQSQRLGWAEFTRLVIPTEWSRERGRLLQGVVHDHNAWALAGTSWSGHAGLFSSLPELLHWGKLLLLGSLGKGPLSKTMPALLAPLAGGSFRMGFDLKSGENSQAGASASAETFGHLGFTGTSLWIDPQAQAVVVLLSNRVRSSWDPQWIRSARVHFNDLGFRLARAQRESLGFG